MEVRAIREEKEIKGIKIRKEEVKLSLFADDIENLCLYLENPELLSKIYEHSSVNLVKLQDTKCTERSCFQYIINERSEKEIKESIPFIISKK